MVSDPPGHTPVLPGPVGELLDVQSGDVVVDATIGLGGHAAMFAEALGPEGTLIGLDVDPANLERARERLSGCPCRVELLQENFSNIGGMAARFGLEGVDVLFADLGVSSTQLDQPERGFSFRHDGPLDMRMDPTLKATAADLVNRLKERELGDLLYFNAQETSSRKIARRICGERRERRITTTLRLAEIVAKALHIDPDSHRAKIHPATRTFLALRMAVNDEIPHLDSLLSSAPDVLTRDGRLGVIAFHSVEDKPVKLDFRRRKSQGIYRVVTKKPIVADENERRVNPRARSAKFRVAVRLPEG